MIGFCQYLLSVEREKSVHIWEHYSISKSVQTKILYLGSWNLDAGFQLMDTPKWIRRGNLEVRDFEFISHLESSIYYVITFLGLFDKSNWSKIYQIGKEAKKGDLNSFKES